MITIFKTINRLPKSFLLLAMFVVLGIRTYSSSVEAAEEWREARAQDSVKTMVILSDRSR